MQKLTPLFEVLEEERVSKATIFGWSPLRLGIAPCFSHSLMIALNCICILSFTTNIYDYEKVSTSD